MCVSCFALGRSVVVSTSLFEDVCSEFRVEAGERGLGLRIHLIQEEMEESLVFRGWGCVVVD